MNSIPNIHIFKLEQGKQTYTQKTRLYNIGLAKKSASHHSKVYAEQIKFQKLFDIRQLCFLLLKC